MYKVSVIIPTYNRAHLISKCVKSVLEQTYNDFEIIIIDDGSIDNTREIVVGFDDPRISYIYQENQGVSAAKNAGIQASSSQYIAFLDSDDTMLKDGLEYRVGVLDKYPEAAFSYGQACLADKNGRFLRFERRRSISSYVRDGLEELKEIMISGHHITTSTVTVRRSCIEKIGIFDLTFSTGSEDVDLWVRLLKKYSVAYIEEPLVIVNYHPQQFSHGRSLEELYNSHVRIIESVFSDKSLYPLLTDLKAKAYFRLYLRMAGISCQRQDNKASRAYLRRAVRIHPLGIYSNYGLPWITLLISTFIPPSILIFARRSKRYLIARLFHNKGNL